MPPNDLKRCGSVDEVAAILGNHPNVISCKMNINENTHIAWYGYINIVVEGEDPIATLKEVFSGTDIEASVVTTTKLPMCWHRVEVKLRYIMLFQDWPSLYAMWKLSQD